MVDKINVLRIVIGLHLGGVQQGVLNLFQQLDSRRYRPIACAIENDGAIGQEIAQAGFPVITLGIKGRWAWPRLIGRLAQLMHRERIHIVHGSSYHPSLYGRLAALLAGVPILISHEHSVYHHRRWQRVILSHLVGRVTDAHIAVSRAVRDQIINWYRLSPARVHVIYNGIRPEFFQARARRAATRQALGLEPHSPVVGTVSRLDRNKGLDLVFAALNALRPRYPLQALIVGTGLHEAEIKAQAAQAGVTDRVRFLGLRRDVAELLAAMDIFVLPSQQEGFSNALGEAMATGLPVVVSDVAGNLEAVQHGVHGLIFPQGEVSALTAALQELLDKPEWAAQLGRAGQERIRKEFTVVRFGQHIQSLYDQLVQEKIGW